MGISHVIRGEEWLPSAPLHVMLYRYLGWEEVMPVFAHLPLLLKPEGNGKLSKRDGDRLGFPVFPLQWTDPKSGEVSSGYRESGYFPDAVANMLALLGWHPSDNRELFSMDELIEAFSLEKVSKSGAKFDVQKAFWFNQQYLQQKSTSEVAAMIKPQMLSAGFNADDAYLEQVVVLMREKVQFARDIITEGTYFFTNPEAYDEDVVAKKWKPETSTHIEGIRNRFAGLSDAATALDYENAFKVYCEEAVVKTGELLQPLRLAVSGKGAGAPIWEMIALIGNQNILLRLENAINKISFSKP
jgi:glutamyl-tRNA synthetase